MARSFDRQGARDAAVFLAQAYAIDLYEFLRFSERQAVERYLGFRDLIHQYFPISDELVTRLECTLAEYRTLETHEVRDEVRIGVEVGTGYSRALLDPSLLDGRDPDEDEELVQIQRRYAGTFLRGHAVVTAIELTIGPAAFAEVKDNLMFPGGPDGYDGMAFWLMNDTGWNFVGERFSQTMKRAVGDRLPMRTSSLSVRSTQSWRASVRTSCGASKWKTMVHCLSQFNERWATSATRSPTARSPGVSPLMLC